MKPAPPGYLQDVGHGIFAIDTGFQRPAFDAAYLMVENGRAAFIDTGTNFALPRLLGALQSVGLELDAVDWVIPTHVHLDHAGGVGALMRELPTAVLLVHPRGARHMIDPRALWAGATAVYGDDDMARSYGALVPVPAERVRTSSDGQRLSWNGRELLLAHTPGHARHHHCIWDVASRGWFTGDTFGLSYREFDTVHGPWIMPTTTPVQFEPDALRGSILRILAVAPESIYLTHFGRVGDVQRLGTVLLQLLDEMVSLGRSTAPGPHRHEELKAGLESMLIRNLAAHGCSLPRTRVRALLDMDIELNAQGIGIWLDRANRAR